MSIATLNAALTLLQGLASATATGGGFTLQVVRLRHCRLRDCNENIRVKMSAVIMLCRLTSRITVIPHE